MKFFFHTEQIFPSNLSVSSGCLMHISASQGKVLQNYHFTRRPQGLGVDFEIKRICLRVGMCSKLSPPGIYLLRWGGLEKEVVGGRRVQPGYVMAGREKADMNPP